MGEELPEPVRRAVTRTARQILAGDAPDEELEELLARHDYIPRIREDDDPPVLVCYPSDWREDGAVRVEAIGSLDRAIELPLFPGDAENWATVARANNQVVERVAEEHGDAHTNNARAFADFMSNHRARRIANATDGDVEEFLTEYYPRNVWASGTAVALVEDSVAIVRETAGAIERSRSGPRDLPRDPRT